LKLPPPTLFICGRVTNPAAASWHLCELDPFACAELFTRSLVVRILPLLGPLTSIKHDFKLLDVAANGLTLPRVCALFELLDEGKLSFTVAEESLA
jgi:hypothetical protein